MGIRQEVIASDYGSPRLWNVCFSGTNINRWWDPFLAPGFRHVCMIGYVPEFDVWLKYEVLFAYTVIAVISGEHAAGILYAARLQGDVVEVRPETHGPRYVNHLGFWCVPAVRHVLGLRCVAITPKGLHRYLLKNGAKSLKAEAHGKSVLHTEGEAG